MVDFIDGIAPGGVLSLNYLLLGFAVEIGGWYLRSFEIWLACTVVFPGAGNFAFSLLEYRLGQRNLLDALVENSRGFHSCERLWSIFLSASL